MPDSNEMMRLLLISNDKTRAVLLSRMIEQRELKTALSVMRPSQSAVACARRSGRFRFSSPFDVILIDFAAPDKGLLSVVDQISFGPNRVRTPTILLTDENSEAVLDSAALHVGDAIMFEPTSLPSFLNKMRQHSQSTFLNALSKLSCIGPILVRMPMHFTRSLDELPQQPVGMMSA